MNESESNVLLSCCPHCGDTTGYEYSLTIKGVQWVNWDGSGENFADTKSERTSKKRCIQCHKVVER